MQPGDLVLSSWNGLDDKAIRLVQRIRWGWRSPYAGWTHAAILTGSDGTAVEANASGIVRCNVLDHSEYTVANGLRAMEVVDTKMSEEDRAEAVAFVESCLGESYGRLAFLWTGIVLLTKLPIRLGVRGQYFCSGLAAMALNRGRYLFYENDMTVPATLAEYFQVPWRQNIPT